MSKFVYVVMGDSGLPVLCFTSKKNADQYAKSQGLDKWHASEFGSKAVTKVLIADESGSPSEDLKDE